MRAGVGCHSQRVTTIVAPVVREMTRRGERVRVYPVGVCASCGRNVSTDLRGHPFPHLSVEP